MKHFLRLALLVAALAFPSAADAAARFLVACTTTCTWDNSSTAIWSTTSGGAPGSAAPTSSDSVTLDANSCVGGLTCTITVNANLNVVSVTMGNCTASTTGCILDFSVNNNNVTAQSFAPGQASSTGTRTLKMGNGTFTITGGTPAIAWDAQVVTGLTLNAGGSTLSITSNNNGRLIALGTGLTYNILTLATTPTVRFNTITANGAVVGTLNLASAGAFQLPNITITNAFTFAGSSSSSVVSLLSGSVSTTTTITTTTGTATCTWCAIQGMIFTGGATFIATNSFDLGGNTGITITAPASGGRIIGGWLLGRDFGPANDNQPFGLHWVA